MDEIKPVLVLDDEQERHEAFRIYWNSMGIPTVHATTVKGAIEILEKHVSGEQPLHAISLDHDLNDYGPNEYDPDGKWKESTGRDVSVWIACHVDPRTVTGVRVHSWNIVGGSAMTKDLQGAGFLVEHRPFKFDDKAPLDGFNRKAKP